MFQDLLVYSKERSPLAFVAVLSLLLFSAGLVRSEIVLFNFVPGWLSMLLFLFLVRLSDDIADIPIDKLTHPDRALCCGRISLLRINLFRFIAVLLLLLIQWGSMGKTLFILVVVSSYSLFFWAKPKLPILLNVVLLNSSLAVFPIYSGLCLYGDITLLHLGMGIFFWLGGLAHDFSHCILDKSALTEGPLNPINEIEPSILAWLSLLFFIAAALIGWAMVYFGIAGTAFFVCLLLMTVIILGLETRLILAPSSSTAKPFYVMGFVFFLLPVLGNLIQIAMH